MIVLQTLNQTIPKWLSSGGVFASFQKLNVPWQAENISDKLDIAYHGGRSGEKLISSLVQCFVVEDILSSDNLDKITQAIFTIYGVNWQKLWATLSFEYDPLYNYDMTETSKDTTSGTHSDTRVETSTQNSEASNSSSVYGFNSSAGQNSDAQTGTGTVTINNNDTDSGTNSGTVEHTLSRKGNIGVTTSQQMLQSERDMWVWHFFDTVFENVDEMLTLRIY